MTTIEVKMTFKEKMILLSALIVTISLAPSSADYTARVLGQVKTFKIAQDGNTSRVYPHYGGMLLPGKSAEENKKACIAYCGTRQYAFGALDEATTDYDCFCGSEDASEDCTQSCLTKLNTAGIGPDISNMPTAQVELFVPFELPSVVISDISELAVNVDGRVNFLNKGDQLITAFSEIGKINVSVEVHSFWGARSPPEEVDVYAKVDGKVECPLGVPRDTTYQCVFFLQSGTDVNSLKIKKGSDIIQEITDVADPMYFKVGADNMKPDRFVPYGNSFDIENNHKSTFINLNHEFTTDSVIYGLEAYVTRFQNNADGCMDWLILEPTCPETMVYCNAMKKCLADTEIWCGSPSDYTTFYAPTNIPVFCSDAERFTVSVNFTCNSLKSQKLPEADYTVVHKERTCATHVGNNIWKLENPIDVKAGHVLGWSPSNESTLDVGFYSTDISSEDYRPEYKYDEVYEVGDGGTVYVHDFAFASASNVMHMVNAHTFAPTVYIHEFTAETVGTTVTVSMDTSSQLTSHVHSTDVQMLDVISGLQVSFDRYDLYVGEQSTVSITVDAGSDYIKYFVHWDYENFNGTFDANFSTPTVSMSHAYQNTGEYFVYVRAENYISNMSTEAKITVRGIINSIEFYDTEKMIFPVSTGTPQLVDVFANGNGLAYINFSSVEANQAEHAFSLYVSLSSHFYLHTEYTYAVPQDVLTVIKVGHPLKEESVAAYGTVEDLIGELSIAEYPTIATDYEYTYVVEDHVGTNVTYRWTWGDGEVTWSNGTFNLREMAHIYTNFGNYTIELYCWNQVSFNVSTFQVIIQDVIMGLEFTSPSMDTRFQQVTNVSFKIDYGTGCTIHVDFGYNDIVSPTAYDMDAVGNSMYGRAAYLYPERGQYNVSVTVINSVSKSIISEIVSIQVKIEGFEVATIQVNEGTRKLDYLEQGEVLSIITTIEAGDDITYYYDVGDGRPIIVTPNTTINVTYPVWRTDPPYILTVIAANLISNVSISMPIAVQMPVQELQRFEIFNDVENSTEEMKIQMLIGGGDFFNCSWNMSDGSPEKLITYSEFLSTNGTVYHQFEAGIYNVTVSCLNRLFEYYTYTTAFSYDPVSIFDVDIYRACKGEEFVEGVGDFLNIYPIECPVMFAISNQEGTNVSYEFDYGYFDEKGEAVTGITFEKNETYHPFKFTIPDTNVQRYKIGIRAFSAVNEVSREFNIELIESVLNVSLQFAEEPVRIGNLANFTISVKGRPYKPCYKMEFGDKDEKGLKYQIILFGHPECTTKEEYTYTIYMAGFEDIEPDIYHKLISYMYQDIKIYPVVLTVKNLVSTFEVNFPAKIFDLPCFSPELQWDSAIALTWDKAEEKSPFFKCRKYNVLTKARKDCTKPLTFIERKWGLRMVEWNNDTQSFDVLSTVEIPGNDTRYVIQPRQLDYGLYQIQFNASMYDTVNTRDVLETEASIEGYFVIQQCDLFAKIEGGTGKAVGQNGTILINATQSTDPDMEPGSDMGLIFEWYCKRNNEDNEDGAESFPVDLNKCDPVTYPAVRDIATTNKTLPRYDFEGCFGTGIGKLSDSGHSGSVLYLNTDFMLFSQNYDLWMKLSQPGREKVELIKYSLRVVYGVPPLVSIECKLNCEKKQNPTQKTSFVAKCTNCNGVLPIYSWQMFGKKAGPDEAYEDETELLRSSASVNIDRSKNLVINPNTFTLGRDYLVKLSVYWDEDSYDTGGFSQYSIIINSPPKQGLYGGCFPNEMSGKALETKFQLVCDDIDDEDKPLTYYWYYLPGNSTTEWREATFPRQGLALSEQFTLSAGNPKNENRVQIKVVVKDLFGAAMDPILLEIKVDPKVLDSAAIDAMLGDENAMSDPAVMGNVMNGLLDSLKAPPPTAVKEEKVDAASVKTKMVSMLANVKIDSPSGCSMVAGTLNGASAPGEEVNDEALDKSLKASGNVATFAGELSAEDLADIAKNTLSATSKFTSVLSGDNAADNIKSAMDSEAALTSGAASNMVAGEIPSPLVTANGVTKVLCIDPKAGSEDLGGIALPDLSDGEDSDCTGATNPVGNNRYGFDKSASAVHGGTLGLGLSSGPGKKKKVQNLTEPIRLVLPNKEEIPPPESYLAYCELMRTVHLVECNVNSSNIFMKLRPWYNNFTGNFFLFMNKGTSPSLVDHQHNCTLPNPYPADFVNMTRNQQKHFEEEERWRCFITQTDMNETCIGRWCVGVIYFTNTTNQTTELKARDYPVEDAKCSKLNYTFYAYTRSCLYWDEPIKSFSGKGCKASAETKDNETICYCNHLTDFGGGGPLAEPQPIDFGAALSGFSNIGDNPTVFSVVMALICVYIIGMVWARWQDKKDIIKNSMHILEDNHPNDSMFYEISVHTGHKSGATTTSQVFIILHGTLGETSPRRLHNPERKDFTQSGIDNFLLAVPYSLGELKSIEIWHNNTGGSPGWFHMQTSVRDMETMKMYTFFCNQWLDVGEEDGLISRKVERSTKSDLTDFNFVFTQSARQNLYDGHIWFSIFTRPASSSFTRCQRVSTCFSLLLTTMLANAMFYTGDDAPPSASIKMGPFLISIAMIKIGITSSLIVVPANLLIVTLFKKAGPKIDKDAQRESEELENEISGTKTPISTSKIGLDEKSVPDFNNLEAAEEEDNVKKHNQRIAFLKSICFAGQEDDEDEKLRKKKKPLPHWLIYIGYFVVFCSSAASAFFVILYGFQFGKPKSDKWIVAMLISFAQSVFLIQPVKIVILSVAFAIMVKDPSRDDDVATRSGKKAKRDSDAEDSELEEEVENITKKKKKKDDFKLPDERKLEEARQARLAEKRIKTIIKEIVVHLLFVMLSLMVAYAASDPSSYQLSETTKKLCMQNGITNSYFDQKAYSEELEDGTFRTVNDAEGVTTRLEWLDWARYSVIEYLFPIGWYNGDKDYTKGFTADTEASKVLAMARFRQLRVKPMSCQKHPVFQYLVEQCNAGYSWAVEDKIHYAPGWQPELNKTMRYRARRGKRKALYLGLETPWRYGESAELQAFPFVGKHATYSGSSYAVSIGPTKKIAKKIWQSMKDNFWVDRYTRAIITEANIYNANTNLLLIVTFLHEILPTGGWSFYYNIQSLRLYRYVGGLGDMIMLFDIVYIFVTLFGWYKVIKGCYKQGFKPYMMNFWQLLHFIVTFSSTGAIVCTMGRFLFVKWAVEMYMSEPELFVSFAYVAQLEYLIMGFIGFVVFFTNLEFLRILRFNRRVGLLTKTIGILGTPMASFAVLFMVVFMAYVGFCHCIYADKLFGYSSLMHTLVSLVKMFLGSFDIFELIDQAPFFGPIMFFSYMLLIQMVLINMFIGIICDAFAAVREASDEEEEANVLSFMSNRMKNLTNAGISGPMAPIYSDWKTDWEVMMEEFADRCDNCIYSMRNIESEEIRNDKWFLKADERKKNVLAGILGMEYFLYETEVLDALQVLDRKTKRMSDDDSEQFLKAAAKKRNEEKNDEDDLSALSEESEEDGSDFESDGQSGNESQ